VLEPLIVFIYQILECFAEIATNLSANCAYCINPTAIEQGLFVLCGWFGGNFSENAVSLQNGCVGDKV